MFSRRLLLRLAELRLGSCAAGAPWLIVLNEVAAQSDDISEAGCCSYEHFECDGLGVSGDVSSRVGNMFVSRDDFLHL